MIGFRNTLSHAREIKLRLSRFMSNRYRTLSLHGAPEPSSFVDQHVDRLQETGTTIIRGFLKDQDLEFAQSHFESCVTSLDRLHFPIHDVSQRQAADDVENTLMVQRSDVTSYSDLVEKYQPRYFQSKFDITEGYEKLRDMDWRLLNCTALHPVVLSVIARTFGIIPAFRGFTLRRSLPLPFAVDNQNYHRDRNDVLYQLKVFVYLNRVNQENGAHCYIRGTHKKYGHWMNQKTRFSDEEIYTRFGCDSEVVYEAPAGSLIIENTLGFHKGAQIASGHRDMMVALFTGKGPKNGGQIPKNMTSLQRKTLLL